MRMTEIVASLAVNLREPLSDFVELVRALSNSADELTAEQPKVLRAAGLKENHVRLRGRPGPGGGVECDANMLSFVLTAYLCDGPRRELAAKALAIATAPYGRPREGQAKCPVTGQRLFGPAFAALLGNRELFDRTAMIRVSSDVGYAKIWWKDDSASSFWRRDYGLEKPWFRERCLVIEDCRFLFGLVNEGERKTSELPASVSLAGRG